MEPSPLNEREKMEVSPFEGETEIKSFPVEGEKRNESLSTFTIPIYFSPVSLII